MPDSTNVNMFVGLKFDGTASGLRTALALLADDAARHIEIHGPSLSCGAESYDFEFYQPSGEGPEGFYLLDWLNYHKLCNNDE